MPSSDTRPSSPTRSTDIVPGANHHLYAIDTGLAVIDPEGRIAHVWQPVKVPGHAQAVLDALKDARSQ